MFEPAPRFSLDEHVHLPALCTLKHHLLRLQDGLDGI